MHTWSADDVRVTNRYFYIPYKKDMPIAGFRLAFLGLVDRFAVQQGITNYYSCWFNHAD